MLEDSSVYICRRGWEHLRIGNVPFVKSKNLELFIKLEEYIGDSAFSYFFLSCMP